MTKACPVASRSEIIVLNSNPRLEMAPLPEPSAMTNRDTRRVLAVYSPSFEFANQLLLTSIRPIEFSRASSRQSAGVSVMKYATGKGDVEGGIRIELRNHFEIPVHLVLLDSAPWYAEIYFSSLSITRQDLDHTTPTSFSPGNISSWIILCCRVFCIKRSSFVHFRQDFVQAECSTQEDVFTWTCPDPSTGSTRYSCL